MLVTAVSFPTIVLAIHILAVVLAFAVVFGFPVISLTAERLDRRAMPPLHRVRVILGRSLVNPGLLVVVIAGVYLASHLHQWSQFYVQFGIGAAVVIGGLEGALVIPGEKKLAQQGAADIATSAGDREITWSREYRSLRSRADLAGWVMALLVAITVVVMTIK
jgi:hypothetical protein